MQNNYENLLQNSPISLNMTMNGFFFMIRLKQSLYIIIQNRNRLSLDYIGIM